MGGYKRFHKTSNNRLPPFVPLLIATLDTQAWRSMSHGARSLYVALRRRYSPNMHNNGRIYLSQRQAMKELSSGFAEIGSWFRELEHYGFIKMTSPGHLGVEGKGTSPRWRLTELGYMTDLPTREFEKWDGVPYRRKTKTRYGKPQRTAVEICSTTAAEICSAQSADRYGKSQQVADDHAMEICSKPILPSISPSSGCLPSRGEGC